MIYELPELPYAKDALAPSISRETVEYHYGKHEKTYIDNLNKLIKDTEYEDMELEEIITSASGPRSIMLLRLGTIYSISLHSLLTALISLKDIFLKPLKSNLAHLKNLRLSLRMLEHQFSDQAGSGFPKIRMESCL